MTFQEIGRVSFENKLKDKYTDIPLLLERLNISKVGGDESEVERIVKEGVTIYDLQLACLKDGLSSCYSQDYSQLNLIPTEEDIWDNRLQDDTHEICLPLLNLQFLSLNDYLMRNYHLLHLETAYQIRLDLEVAIERMHPSYDQNGILTTYDGWCRMAV